MRHTYLGETIDVEIIYKNRKSIGVSIDGYGNVIVQAPKKTHDEQVVNLLEANWELILTKSKEMKKRLDGPQQKAYDQGESFLYLGNSYPIKISLDRNIEKDHVVFEDNQLTIFVKNHDDEKIKQSLKRFYYQQCKALVEKSIQSHQRHFKTKPRSVRITDNQTNWGTCDSNLQLTFNWRLAMAPIEVVDYVVVHEMCHMVHLNHDRSFWRLVGKIMPDYKEKENWLAKSNWKMTV
ncbi:M48 family metallopeptidase [Bacillus luteolus]|uniref:M48 family metallopeptidase n=1 Tax=Litchfieldia luteola TaxID=682179 RepID=A0ABR9QPX4_9BACI|nr:SprT family zinc-dependent metalloprotease [Cytobacillus luteolus]MBE4910552.1 M48 family metallopeptidase [Cytobacillus luteolus]MBP1943729.1 putative metal-dependent hydrolase [Cytobacillus luteolus]